LACFTAALAFTA